MSLSPQHVIAVPAEPSIDPPSRTRIRLWDLPTRVFHWSLVAAVLTAVITGQIGGERMRVHGIAGLSIVGLVVFRLLWGFLGSTHARFVSFVPGPRRVWAYVRGRWRGVGHNPLGALSVIALLALLGVQAGSGLFANDDIDFSGPLAVHVSDALSSRLTGLHHQLADVLLILIGLHVLAIVFYAWFKRDNLVKPMFTGYKEVVETTEPAARHGGGAVAFTVSLVAALAVVYVASGAAFSPQRSQQAVTAAASTPALPASAVAATSQKPTPGW